MTRVSAGLLMYHFDGETLRVLIVHPGDPLRKNLDEGHWSIPKGVPDKRDDSLFETARREFEEETGIKPPKSRRHYIPLGRIEQRRGKIVFAWAFEGQMPEPIKRIRSPKLKRRWPKGSKKFAKYREIDDGQFFPHHIATDKLKAPQRPLIVKLIDLIGLMPEEGGNRLSPAMAEKLVVQPEVIKAETPEEIEEALPNPPNMKKLALEKVKISVE